MSAAGRLKNASQSSQTVAVRRVNWHRSATFQRQYDFSPLRGPDWLCVPGQEQECSPRATGRWPAGLRDVTCSRTRARGPPSVPNCRKRVPNSHPPVAVDFYWPFSGRYKRWLRNHAFSVVLFEFISQILRSLKWPCLRLNIITGPYAEWFVSYNY
jgi:hypothetical protein